MGQKDLTEKNFLLYPDVFADTLNALAYAGREVVCEEKLFPAPSESFYHAGQGKMADQFSDVSMFEMKDDSIRVQYIFENEVQVKARTILRKAGYEGALYRRQLESDETFPIVSLLLYWGLASWNQPVSMKEFFQEADLDENTWKYITNEKLHVYAMAWLPKQVRNRFRSDMRIVVDYLAERQNYKPTAQKLVHPEALLLMLKALTNDDRYIEILTALTEEEKKGEITMCELLDEYENRGMLNGIQEGLKKGMQDGLRKGIQEGMQQGELRLASLIEKLLQSNRMEDLQMVVSNISNKKYQNRLYEEFGIL